MPQYVTTPRFATALQLTGAKDGAPEFAEGAYDAKGRIVPQLGAALGRIPGKIGSVYVSRGLVYAGSIYDQTLVRPGDWIVWYADDPPVVVSATAFDAAFERVVSEEPPEPEA